MSITPAGEVQRILILDLATENPLSERAVEQRLPESQDRRVYHLSAFGATPTPQGSPPRGDGHRWREWSEAIDRMLTEVRAGLGEDADRVHYYVAGRAALPVFAHLGARLGKLARVTVINKRPDGDWDELPLHGARDGEGSEPFFNVVRGLEPSMLCLGRGKVAVFVSTQNDLEPSKVLAFVRSQRCELAGVVEIRARPEGGWPHRTRKWLSRANAAQAAAELEEIFTAIKNQYQGQEGLVVFVAGAAPTAMMVGRAINPRLYTPVLLPNYRSDAYEAAIEMPWARVRGGEKVRILIATANPADAEGRRLDIDQELRHILCALEDTAGADRIEYRLCPAVQVQDMMDKLQDFRPHILHFSGHGDIGGSYFVRGEGEEAFVPSDAFRSMIESAASQCLSLIVLSSCWSGDQARYLAGLADCAIGTIQRVENEIAVCFARGFYRALGRGCSVKQAFQQGNALVRAETAMDRDVIKLHPRPGLDAAELVLFSPGPSRP